MSEEKINQENTENTSQGVVQTQEQVQEGAQAPAKRLFQKVEILDVEKHKGLRWYCLGGNCPTSCCYVPVRSTIGLREMEYLALYFPVSFPMVKYDEKQEPKFELNIFFKLDIDTEGHCVHLDPGGAGCKLGESKPYACKQYPFSAVKDNTGRTLIQLDFTCPGWSQTEGDIVMKSPTELNPIFMEGFLKPSLDFTNDMQESRVFVDTLANYGLIKPGTYMYKGFNVSLNLVDEKALFELPASVLKDFESRGYLRAIYYHLHSLQNYKLLIEAYIKRNPQVFKQAENTAFTLSF